MVDQFLDLIFVSSKIILFSIKMLNMHEFSTNVYLWLRSLKINVSQSVIELEMKSHHEYPSLTSCTDTLDAIGIQYEALSISKEEMSTIQHPFLAHLSESNGTFLLVNSRRQLTKELYDKFTGIVLIANPRQKIDKKYKEVNVVQRMGIILTILLTVFTIGLLFKNNQGVITRIYFFSFAEFFLTAMGIFVSVLLKINDLGVFDPFVDRICKGNGKSKCHNESHIYIGKAIVPVRLSNICLIYFSSLLILSLLSCIAGNVYAISYVLTFSLVFVALAMMLSVGYQFFVIRQWCILCMIINGIILLQCLLLFTVKINGFKVSEFFMNLEGLRWLFIWAAILLILSLIWFFIISPLLRSYIKFNVALYENKRLKKNPFIFLSQLAMEKSITTIGISPLDIVEGRPDAVVKMLIVSDLFCKPCARFHNKLAGIEGGHLQVIVRTIFDENDYNNNTERVKVFTHLKTRKSDNSGENDYERLSNWYRTENHHVFSMSETRQSLSDQSSLREIINAEDFANYIKWFEQNDVAVTPTIFINEKRVPIWYDFDSISHQIRLFNSDEMLSSKLPLTHV